MAKGTRAKTDGKAVPAVEGWRFSWHEGADGIKRWHCPVCRRVAKDEGGHAQLIEHPEERRWPKTPLAQETLRLATTLAQDAWLVDELGPDGRPILKVVETRLREIHRASLKGGDRQDVRFVLKWLADAYPQFHYAIGIDEDRRLEDATRRRSKVGTPDFDLRRPYSAAEAKAETQERLALLCEYFEHAWVRAFGPVRDRRRMPIAFLDLLAAWGDKRGGRGKGYAPALRKLWRTLRGQGLTEMTDTAIRKLATEYRQPKP